MGCQRGPFLQHLSALKPNKTPRRRTSFYGEEAEAENTRSD